MRVNGLELVVTLILLTLCLLVGLGLARLYAPEPAIGILRFEGVIDFAEGERLVEVIEAARQDRSVAGVVLEVLSPGGLASSSESVFYSVLRLRQSKPVVAVVDSIAVSGGYYMVAAANRIYAPASSYVGNIGTRGPRPGDPTIAAEELSSGPYKLTGGDRFDRIRQLDTVKEAFVGNVIHQRQHAVLNPLTIDAETVSEGRIYLGSEAVAVGLVDVEGSRSDAIQAAAELAGLERYALIDLMEPAAEDTAAPAAPVPEAVQAMVESAPPDAVFLLDSRIPLPGLIEGSDLDRHLLKLRKIDPASLNASQDRRLLPALDALLPGRREGE